MKLPAFSPELWQRAGLDDLLGGMSRTEFMTRFALANDNKASQFFLIQWSIHV